MFWCWINIVFYFNLGKFNSYLQVEIGIVILGLYRFGIVVGLFGEELLSL